MRLRVIYTKNPMESGDQATMTFYVGSGLDQDYRLEFETLGWPPYPTVGGPAAITYEPECSNVVENGKIIGSDIVINDLHDAPTFTITSRTMVQAYMVQYK